MRVLKVLFVTHLVAFILPVILFVLAFGPLVASPPLEIGPLIFTCDTLPTADGSAVYGCYGAIK